MLIKFTSKNSAKFEMFANCALQLIQMMGHGGTIPGAISAEDVPAALASLRQALDALNRTAIETSANDSNEEVKVTLAHRAVPLLEMLANAIPAQSYVMWDK